METKNWKAGVAAVAITPDEPMWLAGWAARREPASGKAGELFCKALALENGDGVRAVIVTMDLIAIPREVANTVAAEIQKRWNIPRERILFNSSHTHNGPEVRPDKVPFFEIPPEFAAKIIPYVLQLQERIVDVINAALENLKPTALNVTQAHATFAQNRRDAGGISDHDVPVLEVNNTDGKRLAILFGYACHNLTLPFSFCRYHGDYAGLAQQFLETEFPGVIAMFCAGAGADQDPKPRGTMELAIQHGRALSGAVSNSLKGPKRSITGSLRAAFEEVELQFVPLPNAETLAADAASEDLPRRRKAKYLLATIEAGGALPASYPCPVQVIRLGNELLLIALGGEPVAEYAQILKTEFAGPIVWIAGYSNDMFGYLPTRSIQRAGGYEGARAWFWSALPGPFTEASEELVLQTVRRLVKRVSD